MVLSDIRPVALVVFGTRPEAIKMMPVVKVLRESTVIRTIVVTTGQHRWMLDQVFDAFGERPDVDLKLMTPNQTLAQITARTITEISAVCDELKPDVMLVHGDTTTAMAASIAAFYSKVKIGHVEAGLRSFDMRNPWPEEFNRVAIDCIAEYLFAPTEESANNLRKEYGSRAQIRVTGNTGVDALLQMSATIDANAPMRDDLAARHGALDPENRLILVTGHRRESFGDGFERICQGLISIAGRSDCQIVYPVHLNPNVKSVINERLGGHPSIRLIEPVPYSEMVYLMKRSSILLTDSGGIQEEGPALGKPVLVMRDVTERPEAVAAGAAELVGTDPARMRQAVDRLLDDPDIYAKRATPSFPYGDGSAARRILEHLEQELAK